MTHQTAGVVLDGPADSQQRSEGMPKGMEVGKAAVFVRLGNARRFQIGVKLGHPWNQSRKHKLGGFLVLQDFDRLHHIRVLMDRCGEPVFRGLTPQT